MKHLAGILGLWIALEGSGFAAEPPCGGAGYREFDFWLGQWEARNAAGRVLGTNNIHRALGQCVVQENWTGAGGRVKGKSFNFYDAGTGRWRQTWVDNGGGYLLLEGAFSNGRMQLAGETVSGGETSINRITWTPLEDGRVRQFWEVSGDGGKTWDVSFDGYYHRRNPPAASVP